MSPKWENSSFFFSDSMSFHFNTWQWYSISSRPSFVLNYNLCLGSCFRFSLVSGVIWIMGPENRRTPLAPKHKIFYFSHVWQSYLVEHGLSATAPRVWPNCMAVKDSVSTCSLVNCNESISILLTRNAVLPLVETLLRIRSAVVWVWFGLEWGQPL